VDLLGYKIKGGSYPGRSLLAPPDKDRTLFFSCFDDYRCLASLKGNEKYIYFFGNQPDEVYNISKDPNEQHDIAGQMSKKELQDKRSQVLAWYSKVNAMYEQHQSNQKK
jgi:lipoteichoic acid synthase